MYSIETQALTYTFAKDQPVLNAIDLKVPEGSIYGFLGPNGAGKTTTLRLVLGLLRKQKGSVSIFGKSFDKNRIGILKKTGSLIESPSLYSQLTAHENLEVLRKIYGCKKENIGKMLSLTGIADTGRKKAGQFSLGMKQRLSIAMALLNDPALLILDEPTNGLDPNGIVEIRELLRKLNQERGTTILISSHLLSEIEKLVTHVGVIHKGNLLFQGALPELMKKQEEAAYTVFETDDNQKTIEVLKREGVDGQINTGKIITPALTKEKAAQLNRQLVLANIAVSEISMVKNNLEEVFMSLIN